MNDVLYQFGPREKMDYFSVVSYPHFTDRKDDPRLQTLPEVMPPSD